MLSHTTCKIIQEFLKFCPALELPELWSHVRATSRVRRAPDDEGATLQALRNKFSDEALFASKVVVLNQDDALTLNPLLTGDAFAPLRAKPHHLPFEIVTPAGCLFGPGLPICKAVRDERYQGEIANASNQLCVAFSLPDVGALLSVGIPAAMAAGLDRMGHESLMEFCRGFGFQRSGMPAPESAPQLMLVGWSPASLDRSPPPGLTAVFDHLRKVHEYFGFGLEEIYVWRPTETDIEGVKFCIEHGTKKEIHQALLLSMEKSVEAPFMPPQPVPKEKKPAPADFFTALAQVHEARRRSSSGDIPREFWQHLEQRLDHDLIAPILQQAMTEEPMRRNLLTAFADFSRLLHAQAFLVYEKLSRAAGGGDKTASGPLPQTDFQHLWALSDRFLLLARECHQCHPWNKKPRSPKPKASKGLGS